MHLEGAGQLACVRVCVRFVVVTAVDHEIHHRSIVTIVCASRTSRHESAGRCVLCSRSRFLNTRVLLRIYCAVDRQNSILVTSKKA